MLKITFDNDFNGISQAVVVAGKPFGAPVLVQGNFGQALKSGLSTGYVQYQAKGIINPACGTIEMWVCPLDWTPAEDKEFHYFFEALGEGTFYLYKYKDCTNLWMATCDVKPANERNRASEIYIGDWKRGEWHHIAGTWSEDGVICYVDGKPAAEHPTKGWLPKGLDTINIGEMHPSSNSSTLIDEVRIYNCVLSPDQIAAHKDGIFDLTKENICLKCDFDPLIGEVKVCLRTEVADLDVAPLSARLDIVAKGASISSNAKTFPFVCGRLVQSLSFSSPQPGEYDIIARVILDENFIELRKDLRIPTKEWQGNQLGMADKVLPPWDRYPLKVKSTLGGCVVQCWGRWYIFRHSALPTQITSRGEMLLTQPISLHMKSGGENVELINQSIKVISNSDTRAELAGVLIGRMGEKSIRFETSIKAEYDGLLLVKLSCKEPQNLPLDCMSIDIPLRQKRAMYIHRLRGSWPGWPGNSGRVPYGNGPEGNGVINHGEFIPFVWLGDNDRGLFWFCESDEHWPNSESDSAIEIVRSCDDVRLRLNILSRDPAKKDQELHPNWEFTFGLQATPVKPLPKNWRKWRLRYADKVPDANLQIIWPVSLEKTYVFSWDEIPGNDNIKLMEFLTREFRIDWVKNAKIEKIDNDKTIEVSAENKYLSLKLDDKNTEVILEIDYHRTNKEFIAKMEESKLNIYEKTPAYFLKHFGYPEAMDSAIVSNLIGQLHDKNIKAVTYLCLAGLSGGCPEWPFFKDCAMGPDFVDSEDVMMYPPLDRSTCRGYHESFKVVSPHNKDYCDFIVWKNKQFICSYGIDGVYHDLTQPWGSDNLVSGCGYIRCGKTRPTYPILAYRELYRRMYSVLKSVLESLPKETFTMAHMSGNVVIPILAYDDSYLDGEHLAGPIKKNENSNYLDVLSDPQDVDRIQSALEHFRIEFMGRQWGLMPFFLPEFDEKQSIEKGPTRLLMALLMIHDVSPWANNCNIDALNDAWKALRDFDYYESDFIPYFDPRPPATFTLNPKPPASDLNDNHHVYVSAYQRPNKRTLFVIANFDKVERVGKLRMNLQRLGLRRPGLKLSVTDWLKKESLALKGNGVLPLEVPCLDYRMIVVGAK
jgi:hypothetical protein